VSISADILASIPSSICYLENMVIKLDSKVYAVWVPLLLKALKCLLFRKKLLSY